MKKYDTIILKVKLTIETQPFPSGALSTRFWNR